MIHLGELAAFVALGLSGAAGTGLFGRLGIGVGVLGELLLAVAEVITLSAPGTSETLFAIAPNLVGLGLVLAGIAVVRTGDLDRLAPLGHARARRLRLRRADPGDHRRGRAARLPAIAGLLVWQVLWVLIAVAVLVEAARPALSRQPAR